MAFYYIRGGLILEIKTIHKFTLSYGHFSSSLIMYRINGNQRKRIILNIRKAANYENTYSVPKTPDP